MSDFNKGKMSAFVKSATIRNSEFINNINLKASSNVKASYVVKNKTQELYDLIRKQTEEGISKGVPFIYSNGRRMPFKSHMEMAIRTTIQNEAAERMETAGSNLGIIFYLASEHADSADDHAPYQGKVYVLENWESKILDNELKERIRKYIEKNNIRTLQWVKGVPVWFNTRPNCRHYFIPITIKQAMGDLKALKKELRTKKGTYRKENYQDLKQQRYIERNIRYYKERARNNEILMQKANDPIVKSELRQKILKDEYLVREWQKRQRELIASNPNLKREYRREDTNKMAQDLGVRLHLEKEKKLKQIFKNPSISKTAKQIKDRGDIKVNIPRFNDLSEEKARETFISLYNDFPELEAIEENKITTLRKEGFQGKWHQKFSVKKGRNNRLYINTKCFFGFNKKVVPDDINLFSSGKDNHTIVHEHAHALDTIFTVESKGYKFGEYIKPKYFDKDISRDKVVEELYKHYDIATKNKFSEKIINELLKELSISKLELGKRLSKYAFKNSDKEIFAEAFAKWYLSDNKDGEFEKAFSKVFYKKLEEIRK